MSKIIDNFLCFNKSEFFAKAQQKMRKKYCKHVKQKQKNFTFATKVNRNKLNKANNKNNNNKN